MGGKFLPGFAFADDFSEPLVVSHGCGQKEQQILGTWET